jgi:heme/copper-type cytochrome/quinol oxidase subunit 2
MPSTKHAYEHVWGIYLPIAILVFAIVVGTLLALLAAGARPSRSGACSRAVSLEGGYAFALAGVAAFLVWVTFRAETPIDRLVAYPGLRIRVVAAQWSWRFIYSNGVQVADVDTWHPAPAYVPAGTEIEFSGTSEDVIHGFWVPALHYQRQVLPGYTTHFDLIFERAGLYQGECSVLCGEDHSEMHFAIEAVSPARFREWLAREGAGIHEGSSTGAASATATGPGT